MKLILILLAVLGANLLLANVDPIQAGHFDVPTVNSSAFCNGGLKYLNGKPGFCMAVSANYGEQNPNKEGLRALYPTENPQQGGRSE